MPPNKRDPNTNDLSTICDLEPPPVKVAFVPRARKEIQDITKIDIIDQLDDIVDIALSNEKPQCSAAVAAVSLKAKMLGMVEADKSKGNETPPRKIIFEVIDANHNKPTDTPPE